MNRTQPHPLALHPLLPTFESKYPAPNTDMEHTQSDSEEPPLPSLETLELLYAQIEYLPDQDTRAQALNALGCTYFTLYQENGEAAALNKAISTHEHAVQLTPVSHLNFAEHSSDLGFTLCHRFHLTGDSTDIGQGISWCQQAVDVTKDVESEKPEWLNNLGICFMSRFKQFNEIVDLNQAISTWQSLVDLDATSHPNEVDGITNLGAALHCRFKHLGILADLERAISLGQRAIDLTPVGHPDKPSRLGNLGNVIFSRFKHSGSPPDLEWAISLKQDAVDLMPDGHPGKPSLYSGLGILLSRRFKQHGTVTDLEQAISLDQRAVDLTPDGHPDKLLRLNSLGGAFSSLFEHLGSPADLDRAISLRQRAVDLTPDGHPDKPLRLNDLGVSLSLSYECFGTFANLERAILLGQRAVDLTPDGHPDKPIRLNNLGCSLFSLFLHIGILDDLERAILVEQRALDLMPNGHPNKLSLLNNLASSFHSRFEHLGAPADLEHAISLGQSAVDLTLEQHPEKPSLLSNLGELLYSRFKHNGNLADLEQAISLEQRAVDLTPDGHPKKPSLLSSLGGSLQLRFNHLGSLADLERAISLKQRAVDLTPDGHPDKPSRLKNMATSFSSRFSRLNTLADLERAISLEQRAVDLMLDGHPNKPSLLSNLADSLHSRFQHRGTPADLEEAISLGQRAVDLTPAGHQNKPSLLSNLGGSLDSRFKRFGNLVDLDQAILKIQDAVNLVPEIHPSKSSWLYNLGSALGERFKHTRISQDLENSIIALSSSAKSQTGTPMNRFISAQAWGKALIACSRNPLPAFRRAIELLPRVAWLGLAPTDQHELLAKVGDIVRDAVAAAIQFKEYETAVEWIEQGRSIVWQNMLGLRSPLDDLRKNYPELATKLKDLSWQLEHPALAQSPSDKVQFIPLENVARRASELAIEWEETVEEIRKIPEFKSFLGVKTFKDLAPAAHEDPIVILNIHESRCDALILIPDQSSESKAKLLYAALQGFSYEMAEELSQKLGSLLSQARVRAQETRLSERQFVKSKSRDENFKEILSTLWLHVAKPIVDGLAYQVQPETLPRIWWCATGPLAFLPVHAAGVYSENILGQTLSDYAISSYTPTLTALLEQSRPMEQQEFRILTVSQPSTPYATFLPGTEEEVKRVKGLVGGLRFEHLTKENATVERVLREMKKSHWIHLACHGQQNSENSMESGFLLHDRILRLSEIVRDPLPFADFAFLSACQTAMGDEKVTEESVHLAAGMLFSGCRGVIATMWSISDGDAPQVAEDVYKRMLKDGKPNREEAAHALHDAVKRLRNSGADFVRWVPFIHIGC